MIRPSNFANPAALIVDDTMHSEEIYAPIGILRVALCAEIQIEENGNSACVILDNKQKFRFYEKSVIAYRNGELCALKKPPFYLSGLFYLPVKEILQEWLGYRISEQEGTLYISKHYAEMSRGTARIILSLIHI